MPQFNVCLLALRASVAYTCNLAVLHMHKLCPLWHSVCQATCLSTQLLVLAPHSLIVAFLVVCRLRRHSPGSTS